MFSSLEAIRLQAMGQSSFITSADASDATRCDPSRNAWMPVVIVLDQISHALARKIRTDATRRGLPVFFRKRGHQILRQIPVHLI